MTSAELLKVVFPYKFEDGADPEKVAAKIWAELILQPLLRAVRKPQKYEDVVMLTRLTDQHFTAENSHLLLQDQMIEMVIKEMEEINPDIRQEPPHGQNIYRLIHRDPPVPKPPEEPKPARELITIQTIPAGAKKNREHSHMEQNRIEVIRVLMGELRINFHNPDETQLIDATGILKSGNSVVIHPHQYHSVENFGGTELKSLILGFQLAA